MHTDIFYSILFSLFVKRENKTLMWLTVDYITQDQLVWWFLTQVNIRIIWRVFWKIAMQGPYSRSKNHNLWCGIRAMLFILKASQVTPLCSHDCKALLWWVFTLCWKSWSRSFGWHYIHIESRKLSSVEFSPEHINQADYLPSFCAVTANHPSFICVWVQVKNDFSPCN